jgi:hypothetical protein
MLYLLIHPLYFLFHKTMIVSDTGGESSGWILLIIMMIPMWILGWRFVAEIPGARLGRMYMWWAIFVVFHAWGVLFYLLLEKYADWFNYRKRLSRRVELADRTEAEIMFSPFSPVGSSMSESTEITGLPTASPFIISQLSSITPLTDQIEGDETESKI